MRNILIAAILVLIAVGAYAQPSNNEVVFYGCGDHFGIPICQIHSMRADGSGQVQLTNVLAGIWITSPSWSSDGTKILYHMSTWEEDAIWIMEADGSQPRRLFGTTYYLYGPAMSPDGRRIAFQFSDGKSFTKIFVMNSDGSGVRDLALSCTHCFGFDWSPDGTKLVFSADNSVSVVNADGTGQAVLYAYGANASWSPDGSKIAFQSDQAGTAEIYVMNADGSNALRITHATNDWYPFWSPDGTKLMFHSDRAVPGQNVDIYVMNIDGTDQVRLTQHITPFAHFRPRWKRPAAPSLSNSAPYDFDGDGRSDVAVFRPSDSVWYLNRSRDGFMSARFGVSTDKIVPADYDGDGKADIAIYRDGEWWILNSSGGDAVYPFGLAGDIPVPSDYTGDGRDELAVYRNGQWWVLDLSNRQASVINFGLSDDRPLPADYDGDGRSDIAVFRPSDGTWWINGTASGLMVARFGESTDISVPGDYTGDGKADVAVWRPSEGNWYVLRSEDGSYFSAHWGLSDDVPAPADFDGDGKYDFAIFRPSEGNWYIYGTTGGPQIVRFGMNGDKPIPNAFIQQ